ncbi:MAG: hypothetical protein OXF74_05420 [Rhodobacteraceae bacterium]|nr:hypothetical protein [Paracoccaceae bacterium]
MSGWPDYADIRADGYSAGSGETHARTPFDDGMVRQERRFASALRTRRLTVLLSSDADQARFDAWVRDSGGAWFDFTDTETGGRVRARIEGGAGGVRYRARTVRNRRRWEASMTIEGPFTAA